MTDTPPKYIDRRRKPIDTNRRAFWLDPEASTEFEVLQNRLETQLGFRPSPSQTIKYLMIRLPDGLTEP